MIIQQKKQQILQIEEAVSSVRVTFKIEWKVENAKYAKKSYLAFTPFSYVTKTDDHR